MFVICVVNHLLQETFLPQLAQTESACTAKYPEAQTDLKNRVYLPLEPKLFWRSLGWLIAGSTSDYTVSLD